MPPGQLGARVSVRSGPAGDSDDEVVGVVVGGFECDVVQAIEDHRGEAADAIVPIDEGVVAHQRLQELRGPLVEVGAGCH